PTGSTSTPPSSPRNSSSAPASRRMPRIPLTPIVSPHLETTLSLRSEKMLNSLCPERDSNSHGTHVPGDFESPASTDSAIRADRQIYPFHSWRTTDRDDSRQSNTPGAPPSAARQG